MTEEQDVYLTSAKVCKRYDNINTVTLQRWVRNPELEFPQPLVVGRRWYFKVSELEEWEKRHRGKGPE